MATRLFIIFICILGQVAIAQNNSLVKEIDSLNKLSAAHAYTQKDSAYYYFELAQNLAAKEDNPKKFIATHTGINWIASYHYDLASLFANLQVLDSVILARKTGIKKIDPDNYLRSAIDFQWGTYYYLLNDYSTSRKYFLKMASVVKSLPDSLLSKGHTGLTTVGDSYLAKMYTDEGKYNLAKAIYEKNLREIEKLGAGHELSQSENHSLLASLYSKQGDLENSNHYFTKSLTYFLKTKGNTNNIISTAENLAYNHITLRQLDSADLYLKIIEKNMPKGHKFEYRFYGVQAQLFQENGKYSEAGKAYEKALVSVKSKWKNQKHGEVAKVYNDFGLMKQDEKQPEKALELYRSGLEQLNNDLGNDLKKLSLIKNKSRAHIAMKARNNYKNALADVDRGVILLDSLKPSFKSRSDKLVLIEDAFPLFEAGMRASYELYSKDAQGQIDKAFHYAEKSKAAILLDALLGAKATKFSKIPQQLLEREKQLKSQISLIEKLLDKSAKKSNDKADELYALNQEYLSLIDAFEKEYPTYYDLRYNNDVPQIGTIQSSLTKDEQLISYFYGNEAIYVIAITQDSKQLFRISNDQGLEAQIGSIHEMLGDPKSNASVLAKKSYALYEKLVRPAIESGQKKNLIIIADGLLNYIPYGSLNTSSNGLSYLMENKSIAYAHSATLWSQLRNRKNESNSILAFAPSFGVPSDSNVKTSDNLLPLPHNKREVSRILSAFKGESFTDTAASLSNFNQRLSDHRIVHLATHAILDDAEPEYSYLAFTPTADQESLLYVRDLYNLSLDAGMITLSACESGIGELKRGEGFLSLARGFFYSGAASITSTLWKINDASSTDLMGAFYKNLSQGKAKDVALQEAKKAFLKSNRQNARSHPYYWSGFIVSGNTRPLVVDGNWKWFSAAGLSLVLVGLLWYRKRRAV